MIIVENLSGDVEILRNPSLRSDDLSMRILVFRQLLKPIANLSLTYCEVLDRVSSQMILVNQYHCYTVACRVVSMRAEMLL